MLRYKYKNFFLQIYQFFLYTFFHFRFTELGRMQGAKRVIVFCLLIAVLPVILLFIPLYLRHRVYADVKYQVAESDILEMINGISSVFCQVRNLSIAQIIL